MAVTCRTLRPLQFDYCGRTHAEKAASRHELVPVDGVSRSFSGGRVGGEWSLNMLTNAHPKYADVKTQF